jgi:hypothetical protein
MSQPVSVNRITSRGAIENAQKNAREAPVVDALSETQFRAAHPTSATVLLTMLIGLPLEESSTQHYAPPAHSNERIVLQQRFLHRLAVSRGQRGARAHDIRVLIGVCRHNLEERHL